LCNKTYPRRSVNPGAIICPEIKESVFRTCNICKWLMVMVIHDIPFPQTSATMAKDEMKIIGNEVPTRSCMMRKREKYSARYMESILKIKFMRTVIMKTFFRPILKKNS
jgi:hypothetical protein